MAYADWSDGDYQTFHDEAFYEIFNELDLAYLSNSQTQLAEELFESGWLNFHLTEFERQVYREMFFNVTRIAPSNFDWRTYRQLYDDADA